MSDLVAEYGDYKLPVIDVVDGCPMVFHDGRICAANEVVVGRQRLSGIERAASHVPAPSGLWADFDYTPEGGQTIRESFPVLALKIDAEGRWADAIILNGDGMVACDTADHSNSKFLGYRLGEPGPYCTYDAGE